MSPHQVKETVGCFAHILLLLLLIHPRHSPQYVAGIRAAVFRDSQLREETLQRMQQLWAPTAAAAAAAVGGAAGR